MMSDTPKTAQFREDVWAADYPTPQGNARCPAFYGSSQCKHYKWHSGMHWAAGGTLECRDGEGPGKTKPKPAQESREGVEMPPLDVNQEDRKRSYSQNNGWDTTLFCRERQLLAAIRRATEAEQRVKELAVTLEFCGEILGKVCVYGTLVSGEGPVDPPPHAAVDAIITQIDRAEAAEAKVKGMSRLCRYLAQATQTPTTCENTDGVVDWAIILFDELQAKVLELQKQLEAQWISVAERLPPEHERVIVHTSIVGMMLSSWFCWFPERGDIPIWHNVLSGFGEVTHWRPLPSPPATRRSS